MKKLRTSGRSCCVIWCGDNSPTATLTAKRTKDTKVSDICMILNFVLFVAFVVKCIGSTWLR
jgi:uncharacterized membrane protein YhaH (DUF805 family)